MIRFYLWEPCLDCKHASINVQRGFNSKKEKLDIVKRGDAS